MVTAINNSTGASVVADEVSFSSATSITVKFTLPVDGTYKLYIENPDGNAVQTGAVLTVSDAPAWVTGAGSLGTFNAQEILFQQLQLQQLTQHLLQCNQDLYQQVYH